jgi:hypothetical protein
MMKPIGEQAENKPRTGSALSRNPSTPIDLQLELQNEH